MPSPWNAPKRLPTPASWSASVCAVADGIAPPRRRARRRRQPQLRRRPRRRARSPDRRHGHVPGGEAALLRDLEWLGVRWDEGPDPPERAPGRLPGSRGVARRRTLRRLHAPPRRLQRDLPLASVVDDVDLGITHVIRGADHRSNETLHRRLHEALGSDPPEYLYVGLMLGP